MQTPDDLPLLDISGAAFRADPNAVLAACRARHWIARSARGFAVLSYDGCEQILSDPRWVPGIGQILASRGGVEVSSKLQGRNLLTSEGSEHQQLRQAVQPWFTARRIDELRTRTRRLICDLLDQATTADSFDFHSEIAMKIPSRVFCWMIGADESDASQIASWSGSAIKAFNDIPDEWAEVNAAINSLASYVVDLIERKRHNRADDLTSRLLAAAEDGIIDRQDVASLLLEILAASSDNSSHSASIMVSLLCEYPDQWRALTQDNSLIGSAVEESMRFMPRVRCGMHINLVEVDLGGLHFPAKTRFYLHIAAANRDPAVYPDPDRLDVSRRPARPQLGFGLGHHLCLGLSLARMELQEVLRVILEKWRMLTFAGEPEYKVMDDVAIVRMPVSFQRNVSLAVTRDRE